MGCGMSFVWGVEQALFGREIVFFFYGVQGIRVGGWWWGGNGGWDEEKK